MNQKYNINRFVLQEWVSLWRKFVRVGNIYPFNLSEIMWGDGKELCNGQKFVFDSSFIIPFDYDSWKKFQFCSIPGYYSNSFGLILVTFFK